MCLSGASAEKQNPDRDRYNFDFPATYPGSKLKRNGLTAMPHQS